VLKPTSINAATESALKSCLGTTSARCERLIAMFTVHATRKLLDQVKQPAVKSPPDRTTALGNWYATAILWNPQVALFVNEETLLPVLMPLAPATTLMDRFPEALLQVLLANQIDRRFVAAEIAEVHEGVYAKTASRSLLGIMNEFTHESRLIYERLGTGGLLQIGLVLAGTPCSPLFKSHSFPDLELQALVSQWLDDEPPDRRSSGGGG
jgi:uncharacterized protein DUF6933